MCGFSFKRERFNSLLKKVVTCKWKKNAYTIDITDNTLLFYEVGSSDIIMMLEY